MSFGALLVPVLLLIGREQVIADVGAGKGGLFFHASSRFTSGMANNGLDSVMLVVGDVTKPHDRFLQRLRVKASPCKRFLGSRRAFDIIVELDGHRKYNVGDLLIFGPAGVDDKMIGIYSLTRAPSSYRIGWEQCRDPS
jgi:hypothetical protein